MWTNYECGYMLLFVKCSRSIVVDYEIPYNFINSLNVWLIIKICRE